MRQFGIRGGGGKMEGEGGLMAVVWALPFSATLCWISDMLKGLVLD
jgi:hypothetical protein